jgi:hypothetical protein
MYEIGVEKIKKPLPETMQRKKKDEKKDRERDREERDTEHKDGERF